MLHVKSNFYQTVSSLTSGIALKEKYRERINVLGVTAFDYRKINGDGQELETPIKVPDEQYIVGNIENLDQIPSLKGRAFDFIVSSLTFMHFSDPIGALCQTYEFLKPNGLFLTNGFQMQGLTTDQLSESLKTYKIKMIRDDSPECPSRFILRIKKTISHLELPISYHPSCHLASDNETKAKIAYVFSGSLP